MGTRTKCRICGAKEYAKGLCNRHYLRNWKFGDPLQSKRAITRGSSLVEVAKHFWKKVDYKSSTTNCWFWLGLQNRQGYGEFTSRHFKTRVAHRIAYQLRYGIEIPKRVLACHRCDTPSCVNPEHVFLGSSKDNSQDAANKGRMASGERNAVSKLTNLAVREIRSSRLSQVALAKKYGVTQAAIWYVIKNQTWRHV